MTRLPKGYQYVARDWKISLQGIETMFEVLHPWAIHRCHRFLQARSGDTPHHPTIRGRALANEDDALKGRHQEAINAMSLVRVLQNKPLGIAAKELDGVTSQTHDRPPLCCTH